MTTAIILCAGSSTRFSAGKKNKTLQLINGKPIFMYSLEKFKAFGLESVILVVKENERELFEKFIHDLKNIRFAIGGKRRQDSVLNALKLLKDDEKVLIHDGARPLVNHGVIKRVVEKISPNVCVVPVIPSEDALRIQKNGKLYYLDRRNVFRIQTPQGCFVGELRQLYEEFKDIDFYDDAAAFEKKGLKVMGVDGDKKTSK